MPRDTRNLPPERYGTSNPQPQSRTIAGKWLVIGVIVILILSVMTVLWFSRQKNTTADVSASMAGFSRVNDSLLSMDIDVTRVNVDVPSYCIVTALNYDRAEVGRREVIIPSGGEKTQRIHTQIPSNDIPVSGTVYGCSTSLPAHLQQ